VLPGGAACTLTRVNSGSMPRALKAEVTRCSISALGRLSVITTTGDTAMGVDGVDRSQGKSRFSRLVF